METAGNDLEIIQNKLKEITKEVNIMANKLLSIQFYFEDIDIQDERQLLKDDNLHNLISQLQNLESMRGPIK